MAGQQTEIWSDVLSFARATFGEAHERNRRQFDSHAPQHKTHTRPQQAEDDWAHAFGPCAPFSFIPTTICMHVCSICIYPSIRIQHMNTCKCLIDVLCAHLKNWNGHSRTSTNWLYAQQSWATMTKMHHCWTLMRLTYGQHLKKKQRWQQRHNAPAISNPMRIHHYAERLHERKSDIHQRRTEYHAVFFTDTISTIMLYRTTCVFFLSIFAHSNVFSMSSKLRI